MTVETWSSLPSIVLERIFWYLNDNERVISSQVCKSWNETFNAPSLWQSVSFRLSPFLGSNQDAKALNFATKFGYYLKRLKITCPLLAYTDHDIKETMTTLFAILYNKAQLIYFSLCNLEFMWHTLVSDWAAWMHRYLNLRPQNLERLFYPNSQYTNNKQRQRLVDNIAAFLRQQSRLISFDMRNATMPSSNGIWILECLSESNGNVLEYMNVEDFFCRNEAVYVYENFTDVIKKFTRLRRIYINYNYLSDGVIKAFSCNCLGSLLLFVIKCSFRDPHAHVIKNSSWAALVKACPNMKVHISIDSIPRYEELCPILVPEIPIQKLSFKSGYMYNTRYGSTWKLKEFLKYLSHSFHETLNYLSLEFQYNGELIDDELLMLVLECQHLIEFEITAALVVKTVEKLLMLQKQGTINLSKLYVNIGSVSRSSFDYLNNKISEYKGFIDERRLDFKFEFYILYTDIAD